MRREHPEERKKPKEAHMEFGSTIAILFASSALTTGSPSPAGAQPSAKGDARGVESQPRPAPADARGCNDLSFSCILERPARLGQELAESSREKSGK
jgi:hypothetical protein